MMILRKTTLYMLLMILTVTALVMLMRVVLGQ